MAKHKFQKGKSGNPGGRPKLDPEIKSLCQRHSVEAIKTAISIYQNEDKKDSDRIRCIEIILDRAWGKPIQPNKDLGQGESYDEFLRKLKEKNG